MAKHHHYSHTHIEHHRDGSHTVHHISEHGAEHDSKHAAMDLDDVHDSLEEHLGEPNEDEGDE